MTTSLVKPEVTAGLGPVSPPYIVEPARDELVYSYGFEDYQQIEHPSQVVYSQGFVTNADGWAGGANSTVGYQADRQLIAVFGTAATPNGAKQARRTLTGLVVGRAYTFTANVSDPWSEAKTYFPGGGRIGVEGVGYSAYKVPAGPTKLAVTYTFVATATSHVLLLEHTVAAAASSSFGWIGWDDVTVTANAYTEIVNNGLDSWVSGGFVAVSRGAGIDGSDAMVVFSDGATEISRAFSGLIVGQQYTLLGWVRTIEGGSYLLSFRSFTAAATSQAFSLPSPSIEGATYWDNMRLVRRIPAVTSPFAPMPISGGRITLDENHAPYALGEVEVPLNDLTLLERIDPRSTQRVALMATEAVTGAERYFDLGLRGRTVDHKTGRVTLELASDEALLLDKRRLASTVDSTARTFESSVRAVCRWALGKIGATLLAGTTDADVTAAWDAVNLQTNPTAGADLSGWLASGGTASRLATGAFPTGTGIASAVRVTMNAGSTGGAYFNGGDDAAIAGGTLNVPVREKQLYRVSAYVRTSVSKTLRLSVQQRNAANALVGSNLNGPAFTTTANTWHRLSFVFQAHPGAIRAGLYCYLSSGTYSAGQTFDITGVVFTEGTVDTTYFDGGTVVTPARYAYQWNGTPHLSSSNRRAFVPRPPELFDWKPGQNLHDFLEPLLEASGLRLFCDETRDWRLIDPNTYEVPGYAVVQSGHNATEGEDSISRNTDEWATGVVVRFRWVDADGIQREMFDVAGTDDKVLMVDRESEYPGPGAAAYILNSLTGRGRTQDVVALVDLSVAPGQDVSIDLPGTVKQTGKVRSVTFGLSDGLMELGTRGLTDTLPGSWAAWNPTQTWAAVAPTLKWKDA